jgi:predicted component of type VI protein secretion system
MSDEIERAEQATRRFVDDLAQRGFAPDDVAIALVRQSAEVAIGHADRNRIENVLERLVEVAQKRSRLEASCREEFFRRNEHDPARTNADYRQFKRALFEEKGITHGKPGQDVKAPVRDEREAPRRGRRRVKGRESDGRER